MAFARAVGEIGAVTIISGNLPYRTEVAAVYVFNQNASGNSTGAAAVAVVLLVDLVRAAARYRRHPPLDDEARACLVAGAWSGSPRSATC